MKFVIRHKYLESTKTQITANNIEAWFGTGDHFGLESDFDSFHKMVKRDATLKGAVAIHIKRFRDKTVHCFLVMDPATIEIAKDIGITAQQTYVQRIAGEIVTLFHKEDFIFVLPDKEEMYDAPLEVLARIYTEMISHINYSSGAGKDYRFSFVEE